MGINLNKKFLVIGALSATCLLAFQNCGGFRSSGGDSPQSSQNAQDTMSAAQEKAQKVTKNPGNSAQDIQNSIATLQQLLSQLQGLLATGQFQNIQQQLQDLISQIQADIMQLQNLLGSLSNGACPFNGQSIPNNSTVTAYQAAQVPQGRTCQQETRVCTNGKLSGSYQFASCTVTSGPLAATYSPNPVHTGDQVTIAASGGTPPYSYRLVAGAGTLNGNVYSAPASAETAEIMVTDKAGGLVDLKIAVSAASAAGCTDFKPGYVYGWVGGYMGGATLTGSNQPDQNSCAQFCSPRGAGYCDYFDSPRIFVPPGVMVNCVFVTTSAYSPSFRYESEMGGHVAACGAVIRVGPF